MNYDPRLAAVSGGVRSPPKSADVNARFADAVVREARGHNGMVSA